jgi:hypothetical protein
VTDAVERITLAHARDQAIKYNAVNLGEIPVAYESITDKWLTGVLCKIHPDAHVTGHRLGDVDDGQTNRRRIHITYNNAGNKANLPPSVFCKAAHDLNTRLINGIGGLIQGEDAFYNQYQQVLGLEAPICFLSAYDPESFNSILVLDDMVRHGTVFCEHTTDITHTRAESQLTYLASLHGHFHGSLEVERAALPTFEDVFANIDAWLGWEKYCTAGFMEAESVIPPAMFKRQTEVWPATLKSVAVHGRFPRTFTHNDVHLKNWYIAASGNLVLTDWQCFGKGHWARDFAYTLTTSLTIERRRAWEKELLQFYLDKLHASGGPKVVFADAWRYYREHLLSTFSFWTSTLGVANTHPKEETMVFIERISAAIDDLGALDSFE